MNPPLNSTIPAGSAVALTTATPANIVSLTLAPGNWLVWGFIDAALSAASLSALIASLSLTSGAISPQPGANIPAAGARIFSDATAQLLANLTTTTGTQSQDVGPTVVSVLPGNNPTLYLVAQATFSAGSVGAYGSLYSLPLQ